MRTFWSVCLFVSVLAIDVLLLPTVVLAGNGIEAPRRGVVFVVGGVGGMDLLGPVSKWVLPHAGVPHEVREFVWTHGFGQFLRDLQDERYLQFKARELAEDVMEIKTSDPGRPVYLVGKSGGTGLVVAAAGMLPPGTLERIVLLSSAVSPSYDLRPALRATRGQIVSFYSIYDQFILGWGTSQFGTIDRVYGRSAGLIGFKVPSNLGDEDRALYARLEQISWRPSMMAEGYFGMHVGTSLPSFVGREVAPWLRP